MSLWAPRIMKQVVLLKLVVTKGLLKYPFPAYSGNSTKIRYYELTYEYNHLHHRDQVPKNCSIAHEQRL